MSSSPSSSARPKTLGELRKSGYRPSTVKDEIRRNVLAELELSKGDLAALFPGIVGYEKTVLPQIVNALLSKHDFILLGLRGQAKTRILRSLVRFLDDAIPAVDSGDLNDDPLSPLSAAARRSVAEKGDATPIRWISREARYQEKLATPDVTIADLIGDIDPVKAATRRLHFADEEVIHYGVIPRANRGIFAINELPDLAARIQVGLLNILEEGDVQIRGFPVRIPLDLLLVFSANPEDYTNRGNIITPLKDRIDSQIRTHYPQSIDVGKRITAQEAWVERDGAAPPIPEFFRDVIEEIAVEARKSEFIDQSSGVSARMTISAIENLVSNAERRAATTGEKAIAPRLCDLGSVLPAISGKVELVYEGEQEGVAAVSRHVVGKAVKTVFSRLAPGARKLEADKDPDEGEFREVIGWFTGGRRVEIADDDAVDAYRKQLDQVAGLKKLAQKAMKAASAAGDDVYPYMELVLEGLHQYSSIGREDVEGGVAYRDLLGDMMKQFKE